MNKKSKRQLNIRNKLIGAIAMLLVSSIMVVSTTFAWFTLSTAPEVQGITTTVGANGNLEIALAHPTDNNLIGSDVGDGAVTDWFAKNLTWGNLINLEDAKYRLGDITLLPSRLNIADGTDTMPDTVGAVPLQIPVYGSDGRISNLAGDKVFYGASIPDAENVGKYLDGFRSQTGYPGYGVRALGTSSTMSETELAYRNAVNAIASNRNAANITASKALQNHGAALADIAIIHANGDKAADGSAANYYAYVAKLTAMVTELRSATDNVEDALLNALIAIANANISTDNGATTIGEMAFEGTTLRAYMNGETVTLTAAWTALAGSTAYSHVQTNFAQLVEAYNLWNDTNNRLTTSETKLAALAAKTDKTAGWSDISNAMYDLMNIQKVTINGMTIEELKSDANAVQKLMGGVALQMNAGSGVMANLGALTGNLSGRVTLGDNATYLGQSLAGIPIDLVTTTAPAEGALLTQIAAKISLAGAATGDGESTTVIDVTYGYVLDFVFRTNAANSNLLLQTEGAQRIYGDSQNAATQGAGATMTFDGEYSNLDSLVNMMSGIRVVFQSTANGNNADVHGIAKVVFKDSALKLNLVKANLAAVDTDASDAVKYELTTTQADGATAEETTVYVTVTETNGKLNTAICLNPGKHQYLVKETITDEATKTTYDRWTVKTAMWFEQVVESKETGPDGSEILVYNKQEVEMTNAEGELVFYPEKALDVTTGNYTAWTDDLKNAAIVAAVPATELAKDRDAQTTGDQLVSEAVLANWTADAEPKYYHVYDEDNTEISLKGDLYLHEYDIDATGKLVFRGPKAAQILTGLDQNVVTPVSALVYLDGDYVDNGDVINSENGISNTGKLNLQFASSAQLVPMENTELKTNIGVTFPKVEGLTFTGKDSVPAETDYTFTVTPADNNTKTYTIKARSVVEGATVDATLGTVTGTATQTIQIPAESMKTNIEIIVEEVVTP